MGLRVKFKGLSVGIFILALLVGSAAGSWFSGGNFSALENVTVRAYHEITVGETAVGFSAAQLTVADVSARYVRISIEGSDIRYRDDEGYPSATVGHLRAAGDEIILTGPQAVKFRAIRVGEVDASLHVSIYF
jgi:hypothetical protein